MKLVCVCEVFIKKPEKSSDNKALISVWSPAKKKKLKSEKSVEKKRENTIYSTI